MATSASPLIIGVVSQKGGVGKSSVARLIAREFAKNDWTVKIADMDIQQGTSFQWHKRRAANRITPDIRTETFTTVQQALKDAGNFDLFVLDGAPHATKATLEIARAADLVLLPTGLAIDDLEPQVLLAHELSREGQSADKLAFVLWRVGDSQAEIADAREYIARAGYRTLDGEVPERTGYRRASDMGHAVTETHYHQLNDRADAVAQSIIDAINKIAKKESCLMANLGQLKKPLRKGEPPKPVQAVNNLVKSPTAAKVPLQLRISPEMRRDFKGHALGHDMDANRLFEIVWDYYKKNHG